MLDGVIEVDLGPGVRAGFTSRRGGASSAPWDSLDLGLNVGDDPGAVLENRVRVARWLGSEVAFARQVHGATAVRVDGSTAAEPECDALVASGGGPGLGVLVADCVPVLLADPVARVVGVAHAGRRGLLDGVVRSAVEAMRDAGAHVADVRAAIGPAACGACYEVPAEMRDEVATRIPATWSTTTWGTPALNLPAGVATELAALGIERVVRLDVCTITDEEYFSHRRASAAGMVTGRLAGVVSLTA